MTHKLLHGSPCLPLQPPIMPFSLSPAVVCTVVLHPDPPFSTEAVMPPDDGSLGGWQLLVSWVLLWELFSTQNINPIQGHFSFLGATYKICPCRSIKVCSASLRALKSISAAEQSKGLAKVSVATASEFSPLLPLSIPTVFTPPQHVDSEHIHQ